MRDSHRSVDKKIADITEKLRPHLWYLSEDLAALPLFSDEVNYQEKTAIVSALQKDTHEKDLRNLAPNQRPKFQNLSISQFITKRSLNLFESLHLPREFLTASAHTWIERADYDAARKMVHALKVVNDCAEHAVRLGTDFNKALTKSDERHQLLYQVIEHHRKLMPTCATKFQLLTAVTR